MMPKDTVDDRSESPEQKPAEMSSQPHRRRRVNFWTRQTDLPTYEVVGALERVDPRDWARSRSELKPGSERYRAYYKMHPELEEHDRKLRPFLSEDQKTRQIDALYGEQSLVLALSNVGRLDRFLSREAEGRIGERKVKLSPEQAATSLKGVARYLGADMVGISRLNPAWVYSHSKSDEDGLRWGDPIHLGHPYAISMIIAHDNFDMLLASRGLSLITEIETNRTIFGLGALVGVAVSSYIRNLGYDAKYHGFSGQVQAIPLAVDAGLGELGRCGMLNTKKFGPAVRIVTVTTDLPLAVDRPIDIGVKDLCTKCKKCAEVCPVGAISSKDEQEVVRGVKIWPLDGDACFKLRASHGGIHPCYYCLSACCWTKPQNILHRSCAELVARFALARTVLAWLDDVLYGHQPRQHRPPDWLNFDGSKPNLRERISTFLHHV